MINLSQGGYCGPAARVADALFDGHGGGKPIDPIHLRSFKNFDILTNRGCQALQIAPLSFCKKNVEGQGRFSGPGYTGKNHQLVSGNGQTEVF